MRTPLLPLFIAATATDPELSQSGDMCTFLLLLLTGYQNANPDHFPVPHLLGP